MGMVFQYKPGSRLSVDAQVAGEELSRIQAKHGNFFAPKHVVEASRSKKAVLHSIFEWDDAVAAEKFRVEQAGYLINHIVVFSTDHEDIEPTRAFVSVSTDEGARFTGVFHAMSDAELRAQVIASALRELDAFTKKYRELNELADLFRVVPKVRRRLRESVAA